MTLRRADATEAVEDDALNVLCYRDVAWGLDAIRGVDAARDLRDDLARFPFAGPEPSIEAHAAAEAFSLPWPPETAAVEAFIKEHARDMDDLLGTAHEWPA